MTESISDDNISTDHDTPTHEASESPKARVKRLYASEGGVLLGWLADECRRRGQLQQDMAKELNVTYGYIHQLRTGVRPVANISHDFAKACARYLGVPAIVVKLISGSIDMGDFAWPPQDEAVLISRAFNRMLADPMVWASMPANPETLPLGAKRALLMMYSDVSGADFFNFRQLPDLVHWLQRAAVIHDEHEAQAASATVG